MSKTFTRKGYGRIYVSGGMENITAVEDEIKEMDEFEFEYLPEDYVALFDEYPNLKYAHKFDDLDINELTARCWKKGIHIFCLDNGHDEYVG